MARWFVDRPSRRGIHSVSLRRVLPEGRFVGALDWKVTGCTDDHRRLEPGQVFVATRHEHTGYDGHAFVSEALERGAAGVIVEHPSEAAGRLQVVVDDGALAFARVCQALAGDPSRQLAVLGIAGITGRTLAGLFVRSILAAAGERVGLIGALGFHDGATERPLGAGFEPRGEGSRPAGRVLGPREGFAPSPAAVSTLLAELADNGCSGAIVEAPGEALERSALAAVDLHAALVTDVLAPHGFPADFVLDERRSIARLVHQVVPGGVVVVNADDPSAEILGAVNLAARRVAFSLSDQAHEVDVHVRVTQEDASGVRFVLHGFDRPGLVHLPLLGPRAASAAAAAAALAWALEIKLDAVVAGLESVRAVAGSLERVDRGQDFDVRIDSAATPAALREALTTLRAVSTGRLHCVFAAEGGGDRLFRRALADAVESTADRITITASNPRHEDPNQILDDLLAGFHQPGKVRVEPDRQTAIESTLADAQPGDAILIAGKGRQAYQIFANRVVPFDDHQIVEEWLRGRRRPGKTQRSA